MGVLVTRNEMVGMVVGITQKKAIGQVIGTPMPKVQWQNGDTLAEAVVNLSLYEE